MNRLLERLFFESSWECVYRRLEGAPLSKSDRPFSTIRVSKRYWCADPFLAEENGSCYFFCEVMDRRTSRGLLGVGRLNPHGDSGIDRLIDLNCHSSYPNVFKYRDRWYLIPETIDRRTIELYRAVRFPYEWERAAELQTGIGAVDTTAFVRNGRVYLFIYEPGRDASDLSLAELDMDALTLGGIRHVRRYAQKLGRPAGGVLQIDDADVRPTQCGVKFYGERIIAKAFRFAEDGDAYEEADWAEMDAGALNVGGKPVGTHTYNCCGGYEIYDILRRKFRPLRPVQLALKKLRLGGYRFYDRSE